MYGLKKNKTALLQSRFANVGVPGLEPGKAGPESAVLPLHHTPITLRSPSADFSCKSMRFLSIDQKKKSFFLLLRRLGKFIECHPLFHHPFGTLQKRKNVVF